MQAAEAVVRNDATRSSRANSAHRYFLSESKMRAILVIVADIISEQPFQRKRPTQLLNNPESGPVLRDVEVQNTPTVMVGDEEAGEHTERNRCHGEEVLRRNGFPVAA